MPKLYFKYGTVSSGKTIRLLIDVYQYETNHLEAKPLIIKPGVDTRTTTIWSRVGIQRQPDIIVPEGKDIPVVDILLEKPSCVFADEVHMMNVQQIHQLAQLSLTVPVICYGLRVDWKGHMFLPISVLMAKADKIQEIKTICKFCDKKATQNLKISGTNATIECGSEDMYVPACRTCFKAKFREF